MMTWIITNHYKSPQVFHDMNPYKSQITTNHHKPWHKPPWTMTETSTKHDMNHYKSPQTMTWTIMMTQKELCIKPYGFLVRYFDIGWFYANECSPQIFLIGWPIMPPWFLGSGHSVDSVLAMCAHPLGNHLCQIYVFHQSSITEDNAYMWLPLAFQVQYLDFYICFIALHVVPTEFLWPQTVVFNNMSWKLVHCIKNSLNAKCSLYLLINFLFLCISSNWQWLQSFPIELKVVITQRFSFICFRTVEACTPYWCLYFCKPSTSLNWIPVQTVCSRSYFNK